MKETPQRSPAMIEIKVPKGAQVIGDPGEQLTVILPVAANANKPATEVTSTIDLDGTLNILVDTTNPAETELTTGLLQLRPGTKSEVERTAPSRTQFISIESNSKPLTTMEKNCSPASPFPKEPAVLCWIPPTSWIP